MTTRSTLPARRPAARAVVPPLVRVGLVRRSVPPSAGGLTRVGPARRADRHSRMNATSLVAAQLSSRAPITGSHVAASHVPAGRGRPGKASPVTRTRGDADVQRLGCTMTRMVAWISGCRSGRGRIPAGSAGAGRTGSAQRQESEQAAISGP